MMIVFNKPIEFRRYTRCATDDWTALRGSDARIVPLDGECDAIAHSQYPAL